MRIIGGDYRGRKIFTSQDKSTRPLRDLVRESIFNILEHSKFKKFKLKKSYVLDLFSGTGSFGLECISRGVEQVCFIENYDPSIKILNKNIEKLNCKIKTNIIKINVFKSVKDPKSCVLAYLNHQITLEVFVAVPGDSIMHHYDFHH